MLAHTSAHFVTVVLYLRTWAEVINLPPTIRRAARYTPNRKSQPAIHCAPRRKDKINTLRFSSSMSLWLWITGRGVPAKPTTIRCSSDWYSSHDCAVNCIDMLCSLCRRVHYASNFNRIPWRVTLILVDTQKKTTTTTKPHTLLAVCLIYNFNYCQPRNKCLNSSNTHTRISPCRK